MNASVPANGPCRGTPVPPAWLEQWPGGAAGPVFVRPAEVADAQRVSNFVRGLSQASRYQRFHVGLRELPSALVERFVRYDDTSELVLLATVCAQGRETAVAEARHAVPEGDPASREFALVVHEDYRGAGLGEHLLRRLVQHARALGVARLFGDVQHDNVAMLRLAGKLGFRKQRHPHDARLMRVDLDLATPAEELALKALLRPLPLRSQPEATTP
jgi:acetyltransferase